jgi:tripartite-type tricarboxylate transporter receptor subunit TctC
MIIRVLGQLVALAALAAVAGGAAAQSAADYPNRVVRTIVPYTSATGPDILARTIGSKLAERWKQPVVIENRPGASGNIGADAVAKSPADGYTLMMNVVTIAITPAIYAALPFDPVKSFAPICTVAAGSVVLVTNAAVPAKTPQELVILSKSKPGAIKYSSPGSGTPQHVVMELFKLQTGADLLHVPYKGAAGAVTDLLGGQVEASLLPVHQARTYVESGKLRVLGVVGSARTPLWPEVPTLSEQGIPGVEADLWFGYWAPAGTPPEIVAKISEDVRGVLALPEVREALTKQGLVPTPGSAVDLAALLQRELGRWAKVVRDAKIKPD